MNGPTPIMSSMFSEVAEARPIPRISWGGSALSGISGLEFGMVRATVDLA
jgi:hypothetical protein